MPHFSDVSIVPVEKEHRMTPTQDCVLNTNPYGAPDGRQETIPTNEEAQRRQHMNREVATRSIGYVCFVFAMGLFLSAFIILSFATTKGANTTFARVLPGFIALAGGFGLIFLGFGTLKLRRWSTCVIGLLAASCLVASPVSFLVGKLSFAEMALSTTLCAYFAWLSFSRKGRFLTTDDYCTIVRATPHITAHLRYAVYVLVYLLLAIAFLALPDRPPLDTSKAKIYSDSRSQDFSNATKELSQ